MRVTNAAQQKENYKMKVLLFNGSPRANGCTFTALSLIAEELKVQGIDSEILQAGNKPVQDCVACGGCAGKGKCVMGDFVNDFIDKAATADGFVFGTPVYYAHPTGRILSIMDRMFYAGSQNFKHKPAAVIASARRGGTTASLDTLVKPLEMVQMPIVSSSYWNMIHGNSPEETLRDLEGVQTMQNLAKNMAWLLKCIEAGKKAGITAPNNDPIVRMNFIR